MEGSLLRALQGTLAVLTRVRPKDLDGPTPCASWDVRALVNHFVGTARWWAATIAGDSDVADADYAAGISWPRTRRASGSLSRRSEPKARWPGRSGCRSASSLALSC
jgi:uncharacterized protein (TIGR03083 family)